MAEKNITEKTITSKSATAKTITLDELKIGSSARIVAVEGCGALRRRLLDMGLTPRTLVMVRKVAPLGDPIEICLRGYELTLRKLDAKNIKVEPVWKGGQAK